MCRGKYQSSIITFPLSASFLPRDPECWVAIGFVVHSQLGGVF